MVIVWFFSATADRNRNVIRAYANSHLLYLPLLFIMDMSLFGRVTSINGILIGILGLLMSAILTWLQTCLGYTYAIRSIFWACIPMHTDCLLSV